ncbi:hypothetical protein BN2475_600038 [Paraburkholderia ribeironis]|uniref:Uncharacterized protein n=1 Tax=Paraburkholderia ribeironis TaxID=1247936 RepID=A0A1N7SF29_9BURK|nr:hypothetical protein BN2475_600038 [Paraburkholderia ribeironis]
MNRAVQDCTVECAAAPTDARLGRHVSQNRYNSGIFRVRRALIFPASLRRP